jgi:hypothetical protein
MSTLKQKLQHPIALVAQGFVAGVILFLATGSVEGNAQAPGHSAPVVSSQSVR